jgi:hypothetical protein
MKLIALKELLSVTEAAINVTARDGILASVAVKKTEEEKKKWEAIAFRALGDNPPLMYLTDQETKALLKGSDVIHIEKDTWLTTINDPKDLNDSFFILEGEAYAFNETGFIELLPKGTFFGTDGCLFNKRFYSIKAGDKLVVLRIPAEVFKTFLKKDAKLTLNLARNLLLKQDVLGPLNNFKDYVKQLRGNAKFDKDILIKYFKIIDSALHPHCNDSVIDTNSWLYANRRLPQNITSTMVFYVTTMCPEMLSHPDVVKPIKTASRPRQVFQTIGGKCIALLRDLDTDLFDFISNFCIHLIEAQKVINRLKSPALFRDLLMYRDQQEKVLELLKIGSSLSEEEIEGLNRIWPNNLGEHLANILMHDNDFALNISAPSCHLKQDAVEEWIRSVWTATVKLYKFPSGISPESIDDNDMTVDIMQGSRRAFLNVISPYAYVYREKIMEWAEDSKPKLITKNFNCEEDKLIANAYYYFIDHTETVIEQKRLEENNGIFKFSQTDNTGVSITLTDCTKLIEGHCDPWIKPKPANKYHLIINIGYTFGFQSSDIIRSLMNIFGKKIRSFNAIGKAGGLVGNKGDILIATRIHSDESFEVVNNNLGNLDIKLIEEKAKRPIHVGPMLTVAGTILQNSVLLNFYKKLFHCVGLEMEGLHFAKEIKRYKELGLVRDDIISRFAYYTSDLPLDPENNLR